MDNAIYKAGVLIEALGYIRRFRDRLVVIKLGGSAMEDADALETTLQDVVFLETVGIRPILVHGGGKRIDRAMAALGLEPRKVQGRRYTDDQTLSIVVRVLLDVNAQIVEQIRGLGGRGVSLHSGSLQAVFGEPLTLSGTSGEPIELGRVGSVTRVDGPLIQNFCSGNVVPVLPSLAQDSGGDWLNVNADTAAAAVASELHAEKLVLLTDMPGILRDRTAPESLIRSMDSDESRRLIEAGIIDSGMIPKVEACLQSLQHGVDKIHIVDGRLPHSLLLEIFTEQGVGTEIRDKADTAARKPVSIR